MQPTNDEETKPMRIKIDGMTCGHCVKAVRAALAKVPGVEAVEDVSLENGEAVVAGNPDATALLAALAEEGYEARLQ